MTKRRRPYIALPTKIAAALSLLVRRDGTPLLPDIRGKGLTAKQVMAMVEWDHDFEHALGGSDGWENLTPRPIVEHSERTRKQSIPRVAKVKRVLKRRARELGKDGYCVICGADGLAGDYSGCERADCAFKPLAPAKTKPVWRGRGFQTGRAGKYKAKIGGGVEIRRKMKWS